MRYVALAGLWVVFAPAVSLAQGAGANHKDDEVRLRLTADWTGEWLNNDPDGMTSEDKLTARLMETTVWRVTRWPDLELVSCTSSLAAEGGGRSVVKGVAPCTWSYFVAKQPTKPHGSVRLESTGRRNRVDLTWGDFVGPYVEVKQGPPPPNVAWYGTPTEGAWSTSGAPLVMRELLVVPEPIDPNAYAAFQKQLEFSFDPNQKRAQATGHPTYSWNRKSEDGAVTEAGKLHMEYTVSLGPPSNVDAVIKPKGDYKGWLPWASTKQGQAGNSIAFDVELKDKKTGEAPKDKTARFEFTLLDTTKEPGSCMNSPWADTEPDLKILKADNTELASVGGDGQSAKSRDGLTSSPISVSCFDGGAYGRLQVVAHLNDDTTVTARLAESGSEQVSLPYDVDGNHIADAWEESKEVSGQSSDADDEDEPKGDYISGDGLTLWEEYRGFLENGRHVRGEPKTKDFFLCDTVCGRVKAGIKLFEQITKLKVHSDLTVEELGISRVINRNHAEGPHLVDQHGVLVGQRKTDGTCEAIGGPGTPKDIVEVVIDPQVPLLTWAGVGPGMQPYNQFAPTVAHELLHCCNVWHHGDSDGKVWWHCETEPDGRVFVYEYKDKADVGDRGKGVKLWVWDEDGGYLDPHYWDDAKRVWLGTKGGQHSGCEDCAMRYDCAEAYVKGIGQRYYLQPGDQEKPGQRLCISAEGTGVNDKGRRPQSRYGDAAKDRGDCVDHIRVKDPY